MSAKLSQDRSAVALRRYDRSAKDGIEKAGNYLLRELRKGYTNYYTTQAFRNTIFIRQNLKRGAVEKLRTGYYTLVGVPSAFVVPRGQDRVVDRGAVALAWELGHTNEFNGKRAHRPIAKPVAIKAVDQMVSIFGRAVKRVMDAR